MGMQSTWFFIWGLLWALFFITDGYDLGIGTWWVDEEKAAALLYALSLRRDSQEALQ